jgi:DNA (cytosine-5)-methyltransferase 1
MSKDYLVNYLYKKGISIDYNSPATFEQLSRKNIKWLKEIYNSIIATKNLVNIQQVNGADLEITEKDKYEYILTYSFPCQDLSVAGKQKGMSRDSGSRSGMLWEVERILKDCIELPQILLMENVPQVIGTGNVEHFNEWVRELEKLGYRNYHQNLIATEYGIPQSRNRTFMVSILGDYNYTFPSPLKLKLRLKDMLESNVDKRYYLSNQNIEKITKSLFPKDDCEINKVGNVNPSGNGMNGNVFDSNGVCPTLWAGHGEGLKILDSYIINSRDGVFIPGDSINTLTTKCGSYRNRGNYSVMEDNILLVPKIDLEEPTIIASRGGPQILQAKRTEYGKAIRKQYESGKIKEKRANIQQLEPRTDGLTNTLTTVQKDNLLYQNQSIRKLTPKECFRLMGFSDEDYNNAAKRQSISSLYHMAGDSICTTVLVAIFGKLLGIDWKKTIKQWESQYIESEEQ